MSKQVEIRMKRSNTRRSKMWAQMIMKKLAMGGLQDISTLGFKTCSTCKFRFSGCILQVAHDDIKAQLIIIAETGEAIASIPKLPPREIRPFIISANCSKKKETLVGHSAIRLSEEFLNEVIDKIKGVG
jgi:hypothetical protein